MLAFVFPGQGSQRKGMGEPLFDTVAEYATVERDLDACLGYSMRRLCLQDPDRRLSDTQYTQPSMYVVNSLHWYHTIANGDRPVAVAGHSVGEYTALLAAGVFDLETGLRLVQKRGELMGRARNGAMAAVVGLAAGDIPRILEAARLTALDIANYNSPTQTVISGPVDGIKAAEAVFLKAGARYVRLPVSAAFHSRYMREASEEFASFLAPFSFRDPVLTVVSNVTGSPYPSHNASATIKALLVEHIRTSILWNQSVQYLLNFGVTAFKEIGPGTVLTRLISDIRKDAPAHHPHARGAVAVH